MPPMKVPRSTPSEMADEPMTSCRSWNQTISYTSAAQPLPTKSSSNAGMNRRAFIQENLSETGLRIVSLACMPLEYRELIRPAARIRLGLGQARTEAHTEARRKRRRTENWQRSSAAQAAE